MKNLILVFVFLTSTIYCQNIFINQPTNGTVYASGAWYHGCARLYFIFTTSNGWLSTPDVFYKITDLTNSTSTDWISCDFSGEYKLAYAHSFQIQAKATGNTLLGYHETSATASFSVTDAEAPYSPQNLQASVSANNHPLITWSTSGEYDFSLYKVYKKITDEMGWYYLATTYSATYEDVSEVYPTYGFTHPVYYKTTACDVNSNASAYSSVLSVTVNGAREEKAIHNNSFSELSGYSLFPNFPNPFNPSTNIQYVIKEPGFVRLEIFNILGDKVSVLVNEFKNKGEYNQVFDATNFPSGVYICKINVNDYSAIRKMSLLK